MSKGFAHPYAYPMRTKMQWNLQKSVGQRTFQLESVHHTAILLDWCGYMIIAACVFESLMIICRSSDQQRLDKAESLLLVI